MNIYIYRWKVMLIKPQPNIWSVPLYSWLFFLFYQERFKTALYILYIFCISVITPNLWWWLCYAVFIFLCCVFVVLFFCSSFSDMALSVYLRLLSLDIDCCILPLYECPNWNKVRKLVQSIVIVLLYSVHDINLFLAPQSMIFPEVCGYIETIFDNIALNSSNRIFRNIIATRSKRF